MTSYWQADCAQISLETPPPPDPGVYVVLITLLVYPVSGTCTAERSFSGKKRLQTPLITKDHDRQEIELSCNSAHAQAQGHY